MGMYWTDNGMSWHVLACHGMSWHVMACHGGMGDSLIHGYDALKDEQAERPPALVRSYGLESRRGS